MLKSQQERPPVVEVSQITAEPFESSDENKETSWDESYAESTWFGPIYRFLLMPDRPSVQPDIARHSTLLDYSWRRSRLWKHEERTGLDYICVPEGRIKDVLKEAHDDGGHWGMESTHMKVRRRFFWPKQSDSISSYIKGCKHCAKHTPWTRKPPMISILPVYPLQIMGMDFIGPLPKTARDHQYILHLIDYFPSFSITYATKGTSADDVLPYLETTFSLLPVPDLMYVDNGSHFINSRVKTFFIRRNSEIEERPTLSSKSTGKIESANRFLQDAMRKSTPNSQSHESSQECTGDIRNDWDLVLRNSTHQLNSRIIPHLRYSPTEILFGLSKEVTRALQFDAITAKEKRPLVDSKRIIQEWNPQQESSVIQNRMVSLCQLREESCAKGNSAHGARQQRTPTAQIHTK